MGVQSATLQKGLIRATQSIDATPPRAQIASPSDGARIAGDTISVSGTASDSGGGVVAAVEVSLDNGKRWHPAVGANTWTYEQHVEPGTILNILARASDDSGNLSRPGPAVHVTIGGATR
jgi:hypothetical protein